MHLCVLFELDSSSYFVVDKGRFEWLED
eukprot:SAG31_NODE_18890_length_619_cov_0.934615_1_plen_27_part_10